jgi:hypothetical protein
MASFIFRTLGRSEVTRMDNAIVITMICCVYQRPLSSFAGKTLLRYCRFVPAVNSKKQCEKISRIEFADHGSYHIAQYKKSFILYDMTPCTPVSSSNFRRKVPLPSSGSKSKPTSKMKQQPSAACCLLMGLFDGKFVRNVSELRGCTASHRYSIAVRS